MALDTLWEAAFPDRSRPTLYATEQRTDDGWLPLSDADDFLVDSLTSLDSAQLYTLSANNAEALQKAQQEWVYLERLAQHLKTRDPLPVQYKDPQELPRREIFEERKEAVLYNYKYEAHRRMLPARFTISENVTDQEKFDCREPPEPFSQGGFIPSEKQYKNLMSAAKSEGREKNPDNQKSCETNFAFKPKPAGTWIAKVLQPEAPLPPRTRAREAALNGAVNSSDRLTRFNGEKVPPTRGISLAPTDAPSPLSRMSTPVGGASPASKKRKIDSVDPSGSLQRRKHPNQYTKRREAEEAARLVTAREPARINGQLMSMQLDENPPEPQAMKKKHPNQYTKRREREEAERRAREDAERQQYQPYTQDRDDRVGAYGGATQPFHQPGFVTGRVYSRAFDPVRHVSPSVGSEVNPATVKPKHPNQYTKRREREEAERLAASQHGYAPPLGFVHSGLGTPSWFTHAQAPASNGHSQSDTSRTATSSHTQPPQHPRSLINTSNMTKEELRTHLFKDTELIALLERDHSWLNDDPEVALVWKAKILNSDYPVRTWAMLRKWKEWRAEGKDKRPRDKDGNRIREPVAPTNANATGLAGDTEMTDAALVTGNPSVAASAEPVPVSAPTSATAATSVIAQGQSLAQSPAKRPTRLRTRAIGLDSPQAAPSSPLVNGINARDLDAFGAPASLSFSGKLQSMDQLDSNAKVDSWQARVKPQQEQDSRTEYAANTSAGKGALRQLPKLQIQGTEDQMYLSSAEVDVEMDADHHREPDGVSASQENESEDPLHGSASSSNEEDMSDSERSSSPSTDPGEKDTEYRSGTRPRTRNVKVRVDASAFAPKTKGAGRRTRGEPPRRTRSGVSTRSLLSNNAHSSVNLNADAAPSNITNTDMTAIRRTRSRSQKPHPHTHQQERENMSTTATATATATSTRGRSRDQQHQQDSALNRTTTPLQPAPPKRPGLRPNPPKRTFTEDSDSDSDSTSQSQSQSENEQTLNNLQTPPTKRAGLRQNPPKRTLSGDSETGANANAHGAAPTPTRRSRRKADRSASVRRSSVGS